MALRDALERHEKATASDKELDAARIEIECVEPPGGKNGGYVVQVYPKRKKEKSKKSTELPEYQEPIKRVFESEAATLAYLKKVL